MLSCANRVLFFEHQQVKSALASIITYRSSSRYTDTELLLVYSRPPTAPLTTLPTSPHLPSVPVPTYVRMHTTYLPPPYIHPLPSTSLLAISKPTNKQNTPTSYNLEPSTPSRLLASSQLIHSARGPLTTLPGVSPMLASSTS